MKDDLLKFMADESGATSIEYAFIAALIAMAIIASVEAIGFSLVNIFNDVVAGF